MSSAANAEWLPAAESKWRRRETKQEKIERYEKALREIGLPEHVPEHFDPLDWWHFKACKRGEIARDALGVTAEDLIRETWEEAVPHG